jgi:hypothetical protein
MCSFFTSNLYIIHSFLHNVKRLYFYASIIFLCYKIFKKSSPPVSSVFRNTPLSKKTNYFLKRGQCVAFDHSLKVIVQFVSFQDFIVTSKFYIRSPLNDGQ